MQRAFTLESWQDDGWYVGRLKEAPGVFSQGATLEELEENIRDAYRAMTADEDEVLTGTSNGRSDAPIRMLILPR